MSVDVTHVVEIGLLAEQVFAYLAEFENNPLWQAGMVACQWTSETRAEVGSTYAQQAKFMGRDIETRFRVTAVEPGRSISIESTQSTFPIQVTRSVEPTPEGCRVTAHVRGQPTGWMKLFSFMVKGSVAKDYARLKEILEASDPGS